MGVYFFMRHALKLHKLAHCAIMQTQGKERNEMQTIQISLPASWLDDVVVHREVHNSLGPHTVWGTIAANYKHTNGRGSLVIDLSKSDLEQIIEDADFYSAGYYEASIEQPYKYVLKKARAKLTELKGT